MWWWTDSRGSTDGAGWVTNETKSLLHYAPMHKVGYLKERTRSQNFKHTSPGDLWQHIHHKCKLTGSEVPYSLCAVHRGAVKCKFVLTHRVNAVHSSSKAIQILSTLINIRVDPGGCIAGWNLHWSNRAQKKNSPKATRYGAAPVGWSLTIAAAWCCWAVFMNLSSKTELWKSALNPTAPVYIID